MAEVVRLLERLISASDVERVQVLAEQVLRQRQLEGVLVREVADDGGDGFKAGDAGGTPSAFTGHKLVTALGARVVSKENRLNDAALREWIRRVQRASLRKSRAVAETGWDR